MVPSGTFYWTQLWWSDPYCTTAGVQTDLDMYLLNSQGDTIATSTEANRTNQTPTENINFTNDTSQTHTTDFYLHVVQRAGSATSARLRLTYYGRVPDEWVTTGYTTTGHAITPEAVTVGAVPFFNPNQPETFTSKGAASTCSTPPGCRWPRPRSLPRPIWPPSTAPIPVFLMWARCPTRTTPPMATRTSLVPRPRPPHAAAVAELLWQAQPMLTVAQLLARLQSTARDIGPTGFDDLSGAGAVDAYAAIYGPAARPAVPTAAQPWVDDLNRGGLSRAWDVNVTGPDRPWVRSEIGPASGRYHLVLDASAQNAPAGACSWGKTPPPPRCTPTWAAWPRPPAGTSPSATSASWAKPTSSCPPSSAPQPTATA